MAKKVLRKRSAQVALGLGAALCLRARTKISAMMQSPRKAAGMNPARNSVVVDRVVMEPITSSTMLGGIVSPMMADAESTATTSPRSYFRFSSIPRMVVPTAATSATFEPEMPEKMYMVMTTTCSRPPRRWPISASTRRARGRSDRRSS